MPKTKGAKSPPKKKAKRQPEEKASVNATAATPAVNGSPHPEPAAAPEQANETLPAAPAPAMPPEEQVSREQEAAPPPLASSAQEDPAPAAVDISWSGPSLPADTEVSRQTTWEAATEAFQAKVVMTIPRFEGAGRPRFVPMLRSDEGGWVAMELDRHGHCRGFQSLAKAIDEIETLWRSRTGRQQLTTNAAEIVLAAEQNGLSQITEEMEDMAKKTKPETAAANGEPKAKAKAKTGGKAPKGEKPAKATKPTKDKDPSKLSAIDAAFKVLTDSKEPMNCKEMIEAMSKKGYWTSPGGKTPAATLYSAILRELQTKGKEARFKKTERGKFGVGKTS